MHGQVLNQIMAGKYNEQDTERLVRQFRRIIGSIVTLFSPLSPAALATLVEVSKEDVKRCLRQLYSVLDVLESQDSPIRLLHLLP